MLLRPALPGINPHPRPLNASLSEITRFTIRQTTTRPRTYTIAGITPIVRRMTTITLKSPPVEVTLPEGLTEEKLLAFAPFNNWLRTLTRSLSLQATQPAHPFHADPYALRSVAVQSYDLFGGSRVGFLKLRADVSNGAGEALPGAVFLRGASVAMLIMLIPEGGGNDNDNDNVPLASSAGVGGSAKVSREEEERYVLLTVQPRVPAGSLSFVELPAGMVDEGGSDSSSHGAATFAGAAAREIEEELGLTISTEQLTCLSSLAATPATAVEKEEDEGLPWAMYPSAGGCDEYVPIYMHERRVPRAQLAEWTGRLTGLREHGERITLRLVPLRDLWREGARDAKCLAALALWEGLRREGKL
ncbi:hypothetical protein F5X99DRAFT_177850 [Biscogniauxia marginata]|nr:hypothetical protein F5X99DRAFT_177850 [Biscogniauxia marginata]